MDKGKLFTRVLMVVLILMFLGGITLGAVQVLSAEGQEPPEEAYKQSLTQMPESKEAIVQYLNSCVDFAKLEQAKLEGSTGISVEAKSISFGENGELLKDSLVYAKEGILKNLSDRYSKTSVDFGRDFSEYLWNLRFEPASISGAESKEENDRYTFKVTFPDETNPFESGGTVKESFHMAESQAVLQYLLESYNGFVDIKNVKVSSSDLEIDANVNRLTDKINQVVYNKTLHIEADITFLGELSTAGAKTMSFSLAEKTTFNFTWAGIALSPKTLKMEKGNIKVIGAAITASGDIKVTWSSSNPEVASVDDKGYVKAKKISAEPVIITAEFEFLGKKYSDTCTVTVTVPVTKVKISQQKLVLAAGEGKTLQAGVKPDDATIKDVLWFSKNPLVAVVDSTGKVMGVAAGKTEVYVLSKDGYYKTSCTVTVTD